MVIPPEESHVFRVCPGFTHFHSPYGDYYGFVIYFSSMSLAVQGGSYSHYEIILFQKRVTEKR